MLKHSIALSLTLALILSFCGVHSVCIASTAMTKSQVQDLQTIEKQLASIDDIEAVESPLVKPIEYTNVLSLSELPVLAKKKKFIDLLLPSILIAKHTYAQKLQKVQGLAAKVGRTAEEQSYLDDMIKSFRAADLADLEKRLQTHPTSIILAQASIESGWGTSRFYIEGRNLFGVWSFSENEPRIQTTGTRDGKHMYVKKYGTVVEAVEDYFRTLARGKVYDRFRDSRLLTDDPYEIIKTLDQYCELREEYVAKLKNQMRYNHFETYDSYEIAPAYLVGE
jgi:Bax protein